MSTEDAVTALSSFIVNKVYSGKKCLTVFLDLKKAFDTVSVPILVKKLEEFGVRGNICRSPIAEGVFQKTVNDLNLEDQWEIDSAAIGSWHVGNPPDWRAIDTMKKHNVTYNNHARQITSDDFNHYDYIFGMDEANMSDLKKRAPKGSKATLLLFGNFDPQGDRIIRDPYYDSDSTGFEKCYEQSMRCSKGFLEHLEKEKQ